MPKPQPPDLRPGALRNLSEAIRHLQQARQDVMRSRFESAEYQIGQALINLGNIDATQTNTIAENIKVPQVSQYK
jgi:hypothetical protein